MNQVVKTIYLGMVAMFVIAAIVLNVNFYKGENLIKAEIDKSLNSTVDLMNHKMDQWVSDREIILENIGEVIQISQAEDPVFLKELITNTVEEYPEMTSMYIGFPNNDLIMSNDWIPEPGFLLSERPWYQGALEHRGVIITEPFVDAYTGKNIVSFALAIYDEDNALMCILSCDIPLTSLESDLYQFTKQFKGRTILFNTSGEEILEFGTIPLAISDQHLLEYKIEEVKARNFELFEHTQILGIEGYYLRHVINQGMWHVVSFAPMSQHNTGTRELGYVVWILTVFLFLIFYIFYLFQRRHVTWPLISLENQISAIDIDDLTEEYQLVINADSMFVKVEMQINQLLKALILRINQVQRERGATADLNNKLNESFELMIEAENNLKIQKNQFEALFTNSTSAVAMFGEHHEIIEVNHSFEALFGYLKSEIIGRDLDDIVAPGRANIVKPSTEAIFAGENVQFEAVRYRKDGSEIPMKIIGVPIIRGGVTTGGFGIYQDISTRVNRERYLEYVSTHDFLTNVFNRRHFETYMYDSDQPSMLPISIIMVDLNGLKIINDAYGNEEGDRLLVITAELLKEVADLKGAPVFRIGGDEFVIVLRNADGNEAETLTKAIKEALQKRDLDQLQLSLAFGWAERTSMNTKIASLLKEAEDFMYSQKLNENPSIRNKTVMTVMNTLHEKSKREEQHSKRVSNLSYGLGKALGLRERECETLRMMGLLHDVGKIAIDDKILNKPTKLSEEEFETIKKHPEIGHRILSSVNELSEIANHVLAHHEKWDGSGYPKGLRGDQIPYLARIISIVDAYDAMTSKRSYREGISVEAALKEIVHYSGRQFDPEIVDVFVKHIRELE